MVKPELGPVSRDKEARMRAMVDAAITMFAQEGYGSVSTRRIAELAGCSETLLFRYFGGKKGLIRAIAEGFLDPDSTAELPEFNDVHDCVRGYLLHVFSGLRTRSQSVRVLIAALVTEGTLAQEFEGLHDAAVERLAAQFVRFQQAGDIAADIDVQALAAGVQQLAFSAGFLLHVIYRRPDGELEAIADTFADIVSAGLQRSAVAAPISASLIEATVKRANEAAERLDKVVSLLEAWPPSAKPAAS